MTELETIQAHHQLCDAIHQCVLDENRFLRQHQRAPDRSLLERKRALLEKLDVSLAALRVLPANPGRPPALQAQLEKTRARILQILQLDKENDQLLLRHSLAGPRPVTSAPPPSVALLQKIYARCS